MVGRQRYFSALGFIALLLISYSQAVLAQPPGMMRHGMDEDTMRYMMQGRGYMGPGYGYQRRYMGRMMGGSMWGGSMWGGSMMGDPMMMGSMMDFLYNLDLSKDQREKIRAILKNVRKHHFDLMEKMMDQSDKLADLYDTDKPDPEKIGKVYDDIYKIRREMIQQHIETRNQVYDLLTKEQQEQFRENDPFRRHFEMMF